jgi:hypothetical protein
MIIQKIMQNQLGVYKNYKKQTHIPVLQILIIEIIFKNVEGFFFKLKKIYEKKY